MRAIESTDQAKEVNHILLDAIKAKLALLNQLQTENEQKLLEKW